LPRGVTYAQPTSEKAGRNGRRPCGNPFGELKIVESLRV
jgi:hypothetical protein